LPVYAAARSFHQEAQSVDSSPTAIMQDQSFGAGATTRLTFGQRRTVAVRTTDIAIIGAGPYGLSISAHLRAKGIPHTIYGEPMSSWRRYMPTAMLLRSEPHASNLWDPDRRYTFERFCKEKGIAYVASGRPLPIVQFLDYAEWFQKHAAADVQDQKLTHLSRQGEQFHLSFENGDQVLAKNVILATGHRYFCNIPSALTALPHSLSSHSSDHQDLTPFIGKDVAVIGAGQSSLETAALLHEQGTNVSIIASSDHVSWNADNDGERTLFQKLTNPEAGLGFGWRSVAASEFPYVFSMLPRSLRFYLVGRTWGPSGAWWLKNRVAGKMPVLTSHQIIRADAHGDKVRLFLNADGTSREMEFDHVIAATGFKADISRLSFLEPSLKASIAAYEGAPQLDRFGESSVPGLFFVGLMAAPTFGPVMRFMFGAKHAAADVVRRFASSAAAPQPHRQNVAAMD
jgi:cation diffusion facilitator CzcD-associated flavoprotein CzcO